MSNRSLHRRLAGAATTAVAVLTVAAGCGGSDHDSTSGGHNTGAAASPAAPAQPGAGHNEADVTFARAMIPHHRQALEMATTAESRASSADVLALATRIKRAQGPEIEEMTTWLRTWGAPTAAHSGGGHGDMPGMMTDAEMAAFAAATGTDFDRRFLEMMIRHHEGAVEMARAQQRQGADPAATALARAIERDQAAEITEMRSLLGGE